ncbi:MAG TPA: amino acid deaminase [Streptosporangiaceae bacterium]|nr:amino acid deaminase [Streptosporangiaceae bacterium]
MNPQIPDRLAEKIDALRRQPIAATQKGFGVVAARQRVSTESLAADRPSVFGPDFMTPLLVLRDSALAHNAEAMATWCADAGVFLAPHGKTTMSPQLFARQLAAGAWGITAATIGQAQVYRAFGIDRILIANEVTDRAGLGWLAAELTADPGWECYAYVDSVAGVELLDQALTAARTSRPLLVLVELGFPGGRTGCRTLTDALAVAAAVRSARSLVLAGSAGYEGGIGRDATASTLETVASYCTQLRRLARQLPGDPPAPLSGWLVSAGGSAYFDVVARELTAAEPGGPALTTVLRSGCYLTHDHGTYAALAPDAKRGGPDLVAAIELWAPVLSRPEPELALVCAGRRDVSFDQGLPVPLRIRRSDSALGPAGGMTVTRLDDQHAYLKVQADADLVPGDLVCLGISHPCTTFDKWRLIPVVDEDYHVVDVLHTFF